MRSGVQSNDCKRVQAIRVHVGCRTTDAVLALKNEENLPLDREDAPGWLCSVQSRDDVVASEIGDANRLHVLPSDLLISMFGIFLLLVSRLTHLSC